MVPHPEPINDLKNVVIADFHTFGDFDFGKVKNLMDKKICLVCYNLADKNAFFVKIAVVLN